MAGEHPARRRGTAPELARRRDVRCPPAAGAVLCTTDTDDQEDPPDIRRTGPFLYLRLRRTTYDGAALDAWAARLVPFLEDGADAYVLFRHDEDGTSAVHAEAFVERVERARRG